MVVAAVASTIGVPERPGGSFDDAVAAALAGSDAVIVLDNCEHLLDAVRSCVQRLLPTCASLTFIATSRARLVAPFERVYAVPGMSVDGGGGDAVNLFVDRAEAAGGGDRLEREGVAALCRELDGIALAIELAAARYPSLGLDGLMAGLERRLRFLTSGASVADRHRSLRDAIAWSYHLLSAHDRALLCGVSVFAAPFDVDAAAYVLHDLARSDLTDGLARLADHNLLVAAPGEPTRYRSLESIRQFGAEQLDQQGRSDAIHDRHRLWCSHRLAALAVEQRDDAWCERFDLVAADARAAIMWAADHQLDDVAADLAEQLAEQVFLRGQPAESQRRYEQAARHVPPGADRARLLRLAAGAAASRYVGNDALRLLEAAAAEALDSGDRAAAAEDLARMVIAIEQAPGIIAEVPSQDDVDNLLGRARANASGAPAAEAAIATAEAFALDTAHPDAIELGSSAATLARDAVAPLIESAALDNLCALRLARHELAGACEAIRRRGDVLSTVPLDAMTGFQFNDYLLMASEVHLAVGDLRLATQYADELAQLACYREQDHLAIARRIKVDAMAGDLAGAAERGERFLVAWERAGRPLATTLNTTAGAMTMVHGLLGDEASRRQWLDITVALVRDPSWLSGCDSGWAPTFDALVALHHGRPHQALERLSADIDDIDVWGRWAAALWRPWYAALWAEAAVLAHHPDAESRLRRAIAATAENPIAAAILDRANALANCDNDTLRAIGPRFAELGCRYQQHRTELLLAARI
jgi:predicted ATPase